VKQSAFDPFSNISLRQLFTNRLLQNDLYPVLHSEKLKDYELSKMIKIDSSVPRFSK
jgi:hypothetical protein